MADDAKHFVEADGFGLQGVVRDALQVHADDRGDLLELYRRDEPAAFDSAMGYVSYTCNRVTRGPHEHRQQTDLFVFLGAFTLYLWDARPASPTYRRRCKLQVNRGDRVAVPPGVVHAYQAKASGFVLNFPDQLYRGVDKLEPVDEIRHENDPSTLYRLW